jgi:hypothetical protein
MADTVDSLKAKHQKALADFASAQQQTNDPKQLAAKKQAADDAGKAWADAAEAQMKSQPQPKSKMNTLYPTIGTNP